MNPEHSGPFTSKHTPHVYFMCPLSAPDPNTTGPLDSPEDCPLAKEQQQRIDECHRTRLAHGAGDLTCPTIEFLFSSMHMMFRSSRKGWLGTGTGAGFMSSGKRKWDETMGSRLFGRNVPQHERWSAIGEPHKHTVCCLVNQNTHNGIGPAMYNELSVHQESCIG